MFDRAAVEARLENASGGPWSVDIDEDLIGTRCNRIIVCPTYCVAAEMAEEDAEFIAAAPTDLRATLAALDAAEIERIALHETLRRLSTEYARATSALADAMKEAGKWRSDFDTATARVRVLEAQVRKDHSRRELHGDETYCAVCWHDTSVLKGDAVAPCKAVRAALAPATGEMDATERLDAIQDCFDIDGCYGETCRVRFVRDDAALLALLAQPDPTVHALAVLGARYLRWQCESGASYNAHREAFRQCGAALLHETHDSMIYATPQIAATVAALTQTGGSDG